MHIPYQHDSSHVHFHCKCFELLLPATSPTQAEAGHDVHVHYCASKAQLLFSAMQSGCMPQLTYSQAVEGVALWQQGSITHHVALTDAEQSVADQLSGALASMGTAAAGSSSNTAVTPVLPPVMQRLMDEAKSLTNSNSSSRSDHDSSSLHQHQQQQQCWTIVDADGSQEPLAPGCASLFEAAVHHLNASATAPSHSSSSCSSRVLLLVQNIHFLPFGDQGTAARRPSLLAAWDAVAGVVCVSNFVARYVLQHAVPLSLQPQRIHVVHCATWHAFGRGPFEDCGGVHAQQLPCLGVDHTGSANSSADQQQQQHMPVVGCLKVTPEKGGWLFLALAAHMPAVNFLGVCADPALLQAAAAAGLPNLRLVPPVADVGQLLRHMMIVLAPSVWQEAFGMVVVEAMLRGVPVIVSDQGGLSEAAVPAGMAAANVVRVQPMVLPQEQQQQQQMHSRQVGVSAAVYSCAESAPNWQQRVFLQQPPEVVNAWAAALSELLSSKARYELYAWSGKNAAVELLGMQPQLLQGFLSWLQQL
jgi:glycosyltransferase involved in cell wall biosynthesis